MASGGVWVLKFMDNWLGKRTVDNTPFVVHRERVRLSVGNARIGQRAPFALADRP
jgi:hypothetical protein